MHHKLATIGAGAYGKVYNILPHKTLDGTFIQAAVKRNIINESINFVGCIRELDMLQRFSSHPHFVRFLDITNNTSIATTPTAVRMQKDDVLYPIIEKYDMSLDVYLHKYKLDTTHILHILCQLLLALEYMHSKSIIHRDLKPSNILVNRDKLKISLTDFGMSTVDNKEAHTPNIVPLWYKAPEVLTEKYNSKVDMWSFGCIVYELVTNKVLLQASTEEDLVKKYKALDDELPLKLAGIPVELRPFIENTVCVESVRASATTLLDTLFDVTPRLKAYIREVRKQNPPEPLKYPKITYVNPEVITVLSSIASTSKKFIWFSPRIALLALDLSTRVKDEDTEPFFYTLHLLYMAYKYYLTLQMPSSFEVFCLPLVKTLDEQNKLNDSNGIAIETTILSYVKYEVYRRSFYSAFMESNVVPTSEDIVSLCAYILEVCNENTSYTSLEIVTRYLELSSK